MILAGIVLYNPNEERLKENIKSIIQQVDKVVLIDNKSDNINEIKKILFDEKIEIIYNKKNEGIAYALNQILEYAYENNAEWFISLDQDSVAQKDLVHNYLKYIHIEDVAMMTCNIIDRNFSINNEKNNSEYSYYIDKCITSGAFNNTKILKKLGGFDNVMFIDKVDFDICATIIENNYKIIKINYNGLLHEVGHAKKIRFLGKEQIIYNHSPFRTYYIIRNALYYNKKHPSKNRIKSNLIIIRRAALILIYQNNKIENVKAILRGYIDSKKMRRKNVKTGN